MIVVVIIGLLAALAIPALQRTRLASRQTAFLNDLRIGKDAFEQFALEYGAWPPDGIAGIPLEMDDYLPATLWSGRTPIGGRWDWDFDVFGVRAGLSVLLPIQTDEEMMLIDAKIDDGNLSSGNFRQRNEGFIYILEH